MWIKDHLVASFQPKWLYIRETANPDSTTFNLASSIKMDKIYVSGRYFYNNESARRERQGVFIRHHVYVTIRLVLDFQISNNLNTLVYVETDYSLELQKSFLSRYIIPVW